MNTMRCYFLLRVLRVCEAFAVKPFAILAVVKPFVVSGESSRPSW
jgi:hypothetical protein